MTKTELVKHRAVVLVLFNTLLARSLGPGTSQLAGFTLGLATQRRACICMAGRIEPRQTLLRPNSQALDAHGCCS